MDSNKLAEVKVFTADKGEGNELSTACSGGCDASCSSTCGNCCTCDFAPDNQ